MERAGPAAQRLVCPACNTRYEHGQFCAKDGTSLVRETGPAKADLAGQVVADRYRIVKLLGEGGMGQVYEAHHVNINKRFAIKLLRPEIVANPEAVARFRQEAWSASSIGHENIVEIDDFATLPDGTVYLAMEFLSGRALAERMREEQPIEVAEALDIFIQVCNGLAAAHGKGIVHRDMKPENIFLAEKHGRMVAKILDFGIAKVSGGEAQSLTRTGAIFGTPHYMSPEQAIGNPLDHRSDIYSVGVIMYEVFTGRVPFEAESFMGILTKHITSEPKRPRELAPDRNISPEIEGVIMRAMAKDPGNRYPTMEAMAHDLVEVAHVVAPQLLTPSGSRPIAPPRSSARQTPNVSGPQAAARPPSQPMVAAAAPQPAPQSAPPPSKTPQSGWTALGATLEASRQKSQPSMPAIDPLDDTAGGSQAMVAVAPDTVADPSMPSLVEAPVKPAGGPGLKIAIVAGALIVLGGGAAAFFLRKPVPTIEAVVPSKPTQPTVDTPTTPTTPKATSSLVLVDSEPPGASIVRDGAILGETPETITVEGSPIAVVLKKEGFVDEPVVIDPAKGRKLLFPLTRAKHDAAKPPVPTTPHTAHGSHKNGTPKLGKLPAPPPSTPDPPHVTPPAHPPATPPNGTPQTPTTPGKRKVIDPYERLDDSPPKGNRKGEVLNPYQ